MSWAFSKANIMSERTQLSIAIREKAKELGFDLIGIAKVYPLNEHKERLDKWLEDGFHAGMTYMDRNRDKRIDPSLLLDDAKSVVVVGMNYNQEYDPAEGKPLFSKYALGKDYHKILKDRLYELLDYVLISKPAVKARVFVDSAPVLERAWATEAGLGWVGKNSMLLNKQSGSFFFLGELILDIELDYNNTISKDYCGSCTKCIDACPTNAIGPDRTIDSRNCISYLTIEHKGEFTREHPSSLSNYVFGCDICQDICPWNKIGSASYLNFEPIPEIIEYTREQWKDISEEQFNSIFRDSPVLRTGYKGFMRNLLF